MPQPDRSTFRQLDRLTIDAGGAYRSGDRARAARDLRAAGELALSTAEALDKPRIMCSRCKRRPAGVTLDSEHLCGLCAGLAGVRR